MQHESLTPVKQTNEFNYYNENLINKFKKLTTIFCEICNLPMSLL